MVRKMLEKKMLIEELTQGRELAAQLNQLDPVESREACQALVEKIVSTYDKALSMLNLRGLKREADQVVETFHQTPAGNINQALPKDQDFKKRKTVPKRNEQMSVSVCSGDGGEEGLKEDGHRWRKYGQKDILGAKFPRAYYRCTHRKTQGCVATKKIQRSDYDSSIFQINYKGRHTCIHSSISSSFSSSIGAPVITKKISKLNTDQATPLEALRNLQHGLKVETEMMNRKEEIFDFSSVSYTPFTQIESAESELFMNLLKEDQDLVDYCSPVFLSPTTTSGSDFIQFDWQSNDCGLIGAAGFLHSSESEITATTDMNLTPTSAFESPFNDLNFRAEELNFDTTTFINETLGYFS